ncbi:AAA family ATPase [Methylobacter sp. YRD-M1]|jgi:predicted kinase|uniref:AAA family ATPase n=1 Tax=Methylobacter sp. YRD-M1 TaxID=2911520 RepID=UPI00227D6F24|nr:ATP-binding protein [Methylobacter sp. YRD-M1]WAK04478.1 ATP-binding protein [Methylobacter sp. YRD-M1]
MPKQGTLIFFCGKMGAGKSTCSKKISAERNAVLISEDEWLEGLYPNQISAFEDYLKFSSQMKPLVKSHVAEILRTGTNVVMDFPANTLSQRQWFRDLLSETGCPHELIYLKASDSLCIRQIAQRRTEQPARAAFDTEATFQHVTKYFQEPQPNEGFNTIVVARDA